MSDELNIKRGLLLDTLAEVREKLDNVTVKYDSLQKVKGSYRFIFNDSKNRYDGLDETLTEEQVKEQLERDILTKDCGIAHLNDFLEEMGSCWLDFFGSDSFSDSKRKQQVFFATLCKDDDASGYRRHHVEEYQKLLHEDVPVDILIQIFFATEEELKGFTNLSRISKEGFVVRFHGKKLEKKTGDGEKVYKQKIDEIKDKFKKDNLNNLFEFLNHNLSETEEGLLCLDYKALFQSQPDAHFIDEAQFLKAVCEINWSLHNEVNYVYFLPIPCPDGSNGLVCFGTKNKLGLEDRSLLNALSFDILYPFVSSYKTAWQHKGLLKESIKSAIAAIMSRNMSHNLGSHDISNTKNYFSRRINDECFYRNQVNDEELKSYRSDYRGNVRLLQYIQERMDFIATIVSTDHYPFGPLNFKAEFFDILTNDDCGERHKKPEKNFLLLFLLYSEKYTRISVNTEQGYGNVRLVVIDNEGNQYTGLKKVKTAEQSIKTKLSKLLLAVPGGIMSRHALFTIVENILRNSAKHNQHIDELVLTIKIKEEGGQIRLSFYDNCGSANDKMLTDDDNEIEVWKNIKRKLEKITIIDNNGVINKHDKGLKEMLICALWLQNKDVAETLFNIQKGNDNATKYLEVGTEGDNLCYTVTIEKFERCKVIVPSSDQKVSQEQLLNIHADFVVSDKDYTVGHTRLSDIFPRFFQGGWEDAYEDIEKTNKKYSLVVEIPENGVSLPHGVVFRKDQKNNEERICFYDHLTNAQKQSDFETAKNDPKIIYLDSISGENFTSTLVTPDFLENEVLRYKVIQSALARIAILDERIWNNYRSGCKFVPESDKVQYQNALNALTGVDSIKNVLTIIKGIDEIYYEEANYHKEADKASYMKWLRKSLQEKIDFIPDITCQLLETRHIFVYTIEDGKLIGLDGNEVEETPNFDFVTVHLGLVEKLPGNSGGFEKFLEKHGIRATGEHRPFVSIHSGRGNFSPELEASLKDYPFLSLSAVESALNNSKYLLSELLYNTNYYGKGNINHK